DLPRPGIHGPRQPSSASGPSRGAVLTDRGFTLAGGNKGVLLIHGLTGAPAEVRFLAKRLNRQGFTVHAPNLVGHASEDELLSTPWRDWYAGVRAAYLRL